MANAAKTSDITDWTTKKSDMDTAKTRRDARCNPIASKTFENLTSAEKDALIKQLGVQNGLILDSD